MTSDLDRAERWLTLVENHYDLGDARIGHATALKVELAALRADLAAARERIKELEEAMAKIHLACSMKATDALRAVVDIVDDLAAPAADAGRDGGKEPTDA